jgi:hypothetical protein
MDVGVQSGKLLNLVFSVRHFLQFHRFVYHVTRTASKMKFDRSFLHKQDLHAHKVQK